MLVPQPALFWPLVSIIHNCFLRRLRLPSPRGAQEKGRLILIIAIQLLQLQLIQTSPHSL